MHGGGSEPSPCRFIYDCAVAQDLKTMPWNGFFVSVVIWECFDEQSSLSGKN